MKLNENCLNIEYEEGIWFSKNQTEVSYPEIGNDACFEIEDNSFWFNHSNNCIFSIINNYKPNGTIFDVGGGNGYVSAMLTKNGYNTVLVEPGINGCKNAKKRGIENVICSTFQDIGITESSVSMIGLFNVLEHIEDDKSLINQCVFALKPSGYILITVPVHQFLWSEEDEFAGHFRRYNKKYLETMLQNLNLNILFSTYYFAPLFLPIFFFRTLKTKLGFKKNKNILVNSKEHFNENTFIKRIVIKLLNSEIKKIIISKPIKFGTSCMIIAEKI